VITDQSVMVRNRLIVVPEASVAADPVAALLATAVGRWAASDYVSGQQVVNQGTLGSSLDLRLGSTAGADSNDPAFADGEFTFADDYLVATDASALDAVTDGDFTVMGSMRVISDYQYALATGAYGGAEAGFLLGMNTHGQGMVAVARVSDGVNTAMNAKLTGSTPIAGQVVTYGFTFTRSATGLRAIHDGVLAAGADTSAFGAITNPIGAYIGYHPAGAFSTFRWRNTAIFDRVLSQDDIDLITQAWS